MGDDVVQLARDPLALLAGGRALERGGAQLAAADDPAGEPRREPDQAAGEQIALQVGAFGEHVRGRQRDHAGHEAQPRLALGGVCAERVERDGAGDQRCDRRRSLLVDAAVERGLQHRRAAEHEQDGQRRHPPPRERDGDRQPAHDRHRRRVEGVVEQHLQLDADRQRDREQHILPTGVHALKVDAARHAVVILRATPDPTWAG
jgi:hypothetical protein